MRRPAYALLLALLSLSLPLSLNGCGSGETGTGGSGGAAKKRIIILTNGDHPFWDACQAGAVAAAEELKLADDNLALSFQRGNFTVPGQLDKLKQYSLETDIVAIGISVYDNENPAISDELKKLSESGIKVITIDADVDREAYRDIRVGYIGTDNFVAGTELGNATAIVRPEGGNVGIFLGNKGNANTQGRVNGFRNGVNDKFKEIEVLDDGGKAEVAKEMVKNALDRHPEINVLVGIWAYDGPACVQIANERGIRDKSTIVTFDADEQSIAAMEKGDLDLMIVQDPYGMGYQGVRLLKALVKDDQSTVKEMYPNLGQPDGDIYTTGLKLVVPDEGSSVTEKDVQEGTEFLKLSEFKVWLKKFNLKSS